MRISQSLSTELQVYQEIQRKHDNQCEMDNHENITDIEYRTASISENSLKNDNQCELDNHENIPVIEYRTASISGNSKKT